MKLNRKNKMKNKRNEFARIFLASFLSLAMLLSPLSMSAAYAAETEEEQEIPDLTRKGSLTITFTLDGEPISDGNAVGIYKVADTVLDAPNYKWVYTKDFASFGEVPENLDAVNEELALKLDKYAQENKLTLYKGSQELDENGTAKFSDLDVGLYLVVHTKKMKITYNDKSVVIYTINPFLISVPQKEGKKLIYDVVTKPKVAPEKEVTPPPPTPPRVPQTGQLWWPVMVFGAMGVLFVCAGLIRKSRSY